jgi:hypothetical protein
MASLEEVPVSALPLALHIDRGPEPEAIKIWVEGFDPIVVTAAQRLILRPEGHGVVIEREALPQ